MATSSITPTTTTAPTVSTGKAQDISGLMAGTVSLSLAEAVTSKVQPYLDQATAVQTQLNGNITKISAYNNMQSLLQAVQSAAANLSSQPLQGSNIFNTRVANLTAVGVGAGITPSNPSALLSASVAAGTNTGSHTLIVNNLATAESDISTTQNVSTTAALGLTGSFSIAEVGKAAQTISITSTNSLSDIVAAINGATPQTGVTASVVSIDASHSVLVVSGADTNAPLQFTDNGILTNLGVVGNSATSVTSTTQPTGALNLSGTFNIVGGTSNGNAVPVPVTVTSTMALTDIANAINTAAQSAGGGTPTVTGTANITDPTVSLANAASTFSLTVGSYPVTVSIAANSSLNSIVSAINTAAGSTAASVSGSAGAYHLQIATTNGGPVLYSGMAADLRTALGLAGTTVTASVATNQLTINSGNTNKLGFAGVTGNALSGLGITQGQPSHQVTAAQAANLTIDGVAGIKRSTNTVTDAVSGVSLNLLAADANTLVTLNIAPNTAGATSAIQAFTQAYNNWEAFVTQNEATQSNGTAAANAVLFGDSTMREASLQVDSAVNALVNNLTLADIGINFDANNNLQIDSTTLSQSLTGNFSGVNKLFQSSLSTSSYILQPLGTDYSSFAGNFSLTVTTDATGKITGLSGAAASNFTFNSSNVITAKSGSTYAGMSFTYSGPASSSNTVTVTATQGVANQLYTTTTGYADSVSGIIHSLVGNLQGQDLNLTSRYNTLIGKANDYANFLLQQYGQMTTKMQMLGQTRSILQAMFAMQTSGGHL